MAEKEIIICKKELHHLKEQCSYLKEELEEKNQKLGQVQIEYIKINEILRNTKTNLTQQQEMIQINVQNILGRELSRINVLEKNYEDAVQKISYFEHEKTDLEKYNKELQIQNNQLKRQLQEFRQKTETVEFIQDINNINDSLRKKDLEYQKLVVDWNQLCDKMEIILIENRKLRELAKVPENFGFNVEQIKIGDRIKIEDYKAKIRILQSQVSELENERAQLKHKLTFMSDIQETKEIPFTLLTTEQKKVVAEYALSLYENKEFICPEKYELKKDNHNLKNKIEFLEKQISLIELNNNYQIYEDSDHTEKLVMSIHKPEKYKEIIEMLKNENNDLRQLLNKSLDNLSNFNDEIVKTDFNKSLKDKIYTQHRMGINFKQQSIFPLANYKDTIPIQINRKKII